MSPQPANSRQVTFPEVVEFVSTFGCDDEFDPIHFVQKYTFKDKIGQKAVLHFGQLDNSVSLTISNMDSVLVDICDEFLTRVSIDESLQKITLEFSYGEHAKAMELTVWPVLRLSSDALA